MIVTNLHTQCNWCAMRQTVKHTQHKMHNNSQHNDDTIAVHRLWQPKWKQTSNKVEKQNMNKTKTTINLELLPCLTKGRHNQTSCLLCINMTSKMCRSWNDPCIVNETGMEHNKTNKTRQQNDNLPHDNQPSASPGHAKTHPQANDIPHEDDCGDL